ncbi:hypothetical protein NKI56_29895 [Mesorhizobium sp. M0622]|uniref:DUF4336 domain-containing protein n=1 Tax=unclassified Mesorhizobium TaxID=325217 RepID=UPI0033360BA8
MTVVRLSNGDLFLHSPIKFASTVAEELRDLGRIRHLVSPNQFHYAHIGEWSKAFPEATTWASPRVRQRARARHADVTFARDLEADPPEEWRRDMGPDTVSRWLLQRVHILPPSFKDADSYRHDHQSRIGHDR